MRKSIVSQSRRRNRKMIKLNLAAMLDIMIILLFFLIKNYSATGNVVRVPQDINLPLSESENNNTTGVHVQVSPTEIWVDDKAVVKVDDASSRAYDQDGRRIISLYDELVKRRETMMQIQKSSEEAPQFSGNVNLVIDKTIKYNYIKKILHTCAEAGFIKYKFVVKERFNKME
mgnify:CR=1 FL=1